MWIEGRKGCWAVAFVLGGGAGPDSGLDLNSNPGGESGGGEG